MKYGIDKEQMKRSAPSLQRSLEITRDARFHANSRLVARNRASAYAVSILSTGVIFVSLLPNVFRLNHEGVQMLLACSVTLSVFIIFYSVLDSTNNYHHKSEILHTCARKVNGLLHESYSLDIKSSEHKTELAGIWNKYHRLLEDCPINHDEVDFVSVKLNKPQLFYNYYSLRPWVKVIQRLGDRLKYYALYHGWLLPPAIAIGILVLVVWMVVTGHVLPTPEMGREASR